MDHIPAVKAVMTAFPYAVNADETISGARELLARSKVRLLPVLEGQHPIGVIGVADLPDDPASASKRVREVVQGEPLIVDLSESLDKVLLQMARHHVTYALVVKEERLAGIFTSSDACRSFSEFLRSFFPRGDDDEAA